jgi:predicted O-linked N-acetylglucosamine transferase (SPINDLY family)
MNTSIFMRLALQSHSSGDLISAKQYYERALQESPNHPDALGWLGTLEAQSGNQTKARSLLEKAIKLSPKNADFLLNYANLLQEFHDFHGALCYYNKSRAIKRDVFTSANLAECYLELRDAKCALAFSEEALALDKTYAEAWNTRGNALCDLARHEEALSSYGEAIKLKPTYAEPWKNRALLLSKVKRHEEAAESFLRASALSITPGFNLGRALHQMMQTCDWSAYTSYLRKIDEGVRNGEAMTTPFAYQGLADSELLLIKCSELYCSTVFPEKKQSKITPRRSQKIRVGYVSGEFRNHATTHLMAGVWERHDKGKFEIYGFDNGSDDESDYRARIADCFTKKLDIKSLPTSAACELISNNEIDILVNLNGYFGESRQDIFSSKPSPISVNYLGFPGTIGSKCIDYIVADKIVIPEQSKGFYAEKIVYLPFSYQANDNKKKLSTKPVSRNGSNLPAEGFIYCCFNNNYKITPPIFMAWMRILSKSNNSYLWLLADNGSAKQNLQREAKTQGIDPARLLFAERVGLDEHISRHQLADLFLDTLPYGAHTTASDALWGGVPLLTVKGNTFPGRVGASLLEAVGLPEMITHSVEEYEAKAIFLANNPLDLAAVRTKLSANRLTKPLFDTKLFTEHLELGFSIMYDRYCAGLPPDHIEVCPQKT